MIAISHDPDSGTLYWYFTEIIAGSTAGEGECDSVLLLDDDGQIIGLELELDSSISGDDLGLALSHPQVRYAADTFTLTIMLADVADPDAQPISEAAILDFDHVGMLQGCEVQPDASFELDRRLTRLTPFMVGLDEDNDEADATATVEIAPVSAARDETDHPQPEASNDDQIASSPGRSQPPTPSMPPPDLSIRSGFVALVGKPNVGKSTLLNALLGEKVAIVSPKPQTTRIPMRGILGLPGAQIIFVDTPGIHDPRTKLGTFMVDQARRAIPDADIICMIVDITEAPGRLDRKIAELVRKARVPKLLVLNKVDIRITNGQQHLDAYRELGPWDNELAVSAVQATGLETLVEELVKRLPEGGAFFPDGLKTDQSVRERSAELVREQVLRRTEQEVPHSVAVEVEEWEDRGAVIYTRMTVYVEKDSQKAILIGAKGTMLKQIGSGARTGIERMVNKTVYLDLWVKARANWRDDPASLRWLGYTDKS